MVSATVADEVVQEVAAVEAVAVAAHLEDEVVREVEEEAASLASKEEPKSSLYAHWIQG